VVQGCIETRNQNGGKFKETGGQSASQSEQSEVADQYGLAYSAKTFTSSFSNTAQHAPYATGTPTA
jgi:hypothetical protein